MTANASTVVLCDLDSTIRNSSQRHHLSPVNNPSSTWHDYSVAGINDTPMPGTITLLRLLSPYHQVHIISGSNESARNETMSWLRTHVGLNYIDAVRLRSFDDTLDGAPTPNGAYKVAYARELEARGLQVVLALDDWPEVVTALSDAGYPVICVSAMYPCPSCGAAPG